MWMCTVFLAGAIINPGYGSLPTSSLLFLHVAVELNMIYLMKSGEFSFRYQQITEVTEEKTLKCER